MTVKDDGVLRTFDTGATRDTSTDKLDMEGFTHPMVMKQFAKYMNMNRLQSNGTLRDSDNWQAGIPLDVYIKSMKRHFDDVWAEHRGFDTDAGLTASLCGLMFNVMGYLYESLKDMGWELQDFDGEEPTPDMAERKMKIEKEKTWVKVEEGDEYCEAYDQDSYNTLVRAMLDDQFFALLDNRFYGGAE